MFMHKIHKTYATEYQLDVGSVKGLSQIDPVPPR